VLFVFSRFVMGRLTKAEGRQKRMEEEIIIEVASAA
jgi:hypothetical protein